MPMIPQELRYVISDRRKNAAEIRNRRILSKSHQMAATSSYPLERIAVV